MKTLISILFILTFYTLKGNNNQTITGHVSDYKKNDLIAVTVRYFVDDSIFVKGCTTNSKGEFKLEVPQNNKIQRLVFTYLGYKDLVINLQPCQEAVIRLGDLIMKKDAIQIHEVTVLGESQVRTEDKLMVYPTKEELRHAYDGFSALDALMIPGLNVNPFDHSVNYMNQSVLFCIDGREATQDEVRDLNAKYIKRVDLYPAGKPEFPQASTVIDYVMKERDYAGTVAFNANHHLTHLEGDGRVNTQYYQGKSEFAVSASGTYNDYRVKEEGYTKTVYNFPNETITRTFKNLPSDNNAYKLNGYANPNIPILIISGSRDLVSMNSRLAKSLYKMYKAGGVENLQMVIYPGARHELLMEINYADVQRDILDFFNSIARSNRKKKME